MKIVRMSRTNVFGFMVGQFSDRVCKHVFPGPDRTHYWQPLPLAPWVERVGRVQNLNGRAISIPDVNSYPSGVAIYFKQTPVRRGLRPEARSASPLWRA